MLWWEMGEKQTPTSLCVQLTFKRGGAGVDLVTPSHRCRSRELALELGCRSWGARRVVKHSPCGALLFLRRHGLTFGGTRLAGLNGEGCEKVMLNTSRGGRERDGRRLRAPGPAPQRVQPHSRSSLQPQPSLARIWGGTHVAHPEFVRAFRKNGPFSLFCRFSTAQPS